MPFIALRKNGQPDERCDELHSYGGMHCMQDMAHTLTRRSRHLSQALSLLVVPAGPVVSSAMSDGCGAKQPSFVRLTKYYCTLYSNSPHSRGAVGGAAGVAEGGNGLLRQRHGRVYRSSSGRLLGSQGRKWSEVRAISAVRLAQTRPGLACPPAARER